MHEEHYCRYIDFFKRKRKMYNDITFKLLRRAGNMTYLYQPSREFLEAPSNFLVQDFLYY